MRGREPIVPQRRRHIPPQFSWVDHRLVRDNHLQGRSALALALYLFLVTVADSDGLSWYSEATLCRYLSCGGTDLRGARSELQQQGLIAFRSPLYQVLDLSLMPAPTVSNHNRGGEPVAIGEVLHRILGGSR